MTCSTFYDLAERGYDQWLCLAEDARRRNRCRGFLLLGLSMGCLGIFFFVAARSVSYGRMSILRTLLKIGSAAFAMSWIGLSIYQTFSGYSSYRQLQEMRSAGAEQHVQGIVVEFSPYDLSKNSAYESFKVDHRTFSYSPNEVRPGFRQTHSKGSPIQNGVYVRISSIGNSITRLEICNAAP
jgi:hypothetical protein